MFDLIEDSLSTFEKELAVHLKSSVAFIEAIGDNLVTAGGKRLRPSLSFLAAELLGVDKSVSMPAALSVELLHSASLLHDDLIDDADTRRGREAAFKRYGNIVSIFAGDFMLAKVLGLLASTNNADFTQLMSDTAAMICEGEVLQFQTATLEMFSFETYTKIIEGKTAILIAAALESVAIIAKSPQAEREALRDFGMAYGRAFQMQDDYLDLLSDEATLGKPIGGDLREGKATYPILVLFDADVEEAREIIRRHARKENDVERMIQLVQQHGADKATKEKIINEANIAIKALDVFPDSEAKKHLVGLAEREIKRLK